MKISRHTGEIFSACGRKKIFLREEINFLPYENKFLCGRKNIFLREKIYGHTGENLTGIREKILRAYGRKSYGIREEIIYIIYQACKLILPPKTLILILKKRGRVR